MAKYSVDPVVCDYGLYDDGNLRLIIQSRRNALLIKAILEKDDDREHRVFTEEDYKQFVEQYREE